MTKTDAKKATEAAGRFLRAPLVMLVLTVLTLLSFSYSYQAFAKATEEAQVRASLIEVQNDAIERQNERLRVAFCGIVEPYAAITTPPPSESAKTLRDSFKVAASNEGLGCTPDPTDGK